MEILFTGTFPPHPGGSGVVNGQLLEGLLKAGHHLQIVTPATPKDLGRPNLMRKHFRGAELFEFSAGQPNIEPWSNGFDDETAKQHIADTVQLCESRIKENLPDLLLIGREASLWGVPDLAARYGVPTAVICHGIGHIIAGRVSPALVQRALSEFQKVDLVITPAQHMAKTLSERGIENVCAIPNCVDTALYSPGAADTALRKSLRIRDDQIVIVHASNLKPVKRPLDIIASAEACLAVNSGLLYLIIGEGPCLEEMRDAVRRNGIEDNFRFTGWVDRDRMPDLLRLADIAVMPSAAEGLAMAYLEAMATGPVLIASDIASAREVITEGETGFLFPVASTDALARTTLRLAADAALRARVGTRARTHIKTHHPLKTSVDLLSAALITLTRERESAPARQNG